MKENAMKWTTTAGLAVLAACCQAWAGDAPKSPEPTELPQEQASIPFINLDSTIRSWQADGEQGLWIQDQRKNWYYAQTFGRCEGLEFAPRLAFKPGTTNTLDRFGEVIVPHYGRCALKSLTKSEEPPKGKRHKEVTQDK
jgi:hypothetical protein